MIELANYLLIGLGWLMVLLVFYVVLFRIYYHSAENRPWWLWPAALVFLFLDFLVNQTIMSVLCLDIRGWTVTDRMKEYKRKLDPNRNRLSWYRFYMADSLCKILTVFDEGHC